MNIKTTLLSSLFISAAFLQSAEMILPQQRNAFYASEEVEVTVAGLGNQAKAEVEISPKGGGTTSPVKWSVQGDGGSLTCRLPAGSLAPGKYSVALDGKESAVLTVLSGVPNSSMPVSQTTAKPFEGGGNFHVGNAACFGLLDKDGQPLKDVRGKRSAGISSMEKMLESGYPAICYMYWTGFVTHKPFGAQKSWANAEMQEAMRLLNFSATQRLRRYGSLWKGVGPIDEPGLSWGKTPGGGMASGFPNWDERPWYEARGWNFTQDIAAQSDSDWMKYMAVRCGIIKESYQLAKDDVTAVWPGAKFEGDIYAPHAIMDGCDPLNQTVNDTPTSHVFFDWFGGPMSVPGQFQIEKCHAPGSKLAHAMNGQLEGVRGPQRPLYNWLMNGMLQGGLASNWWLNTNGMTDADLKAVNEPVTEYGPMFQEMSLDGHEIAILWGFTELSMRQKEMAKRESSKKSGEQLKLLFPMPDAAEMKESELDSSAYEVGGSYINAILRLHQTLRRAGYAPQVLHEGLLPDGILKKYKVLCIVGQNADLPDHVKSAIAGFVKGGGSLLIDKSSKLQLPGAKIIDVDLGAENLRQLALRNAEMAKSAKDKLEGSRYATNMHLDDEWSGAIVPVKAAIGQTAAKAIVTTDSLNLSAGRQVGGDGELIMVLNGAEKLPEGLAADQAFPRYNPAPATHTYTLNNIPKGAAVWCIEGLDWKKVTKLSDPSAPITSDFAAGEMKLYLVAPKTPKGLKLKTSAGAATLSAGLSLDGVKMPWPLLVSVLAPNGDVLYSVRRSTDKSGKYAETFPIGKNAPAGGYTVKVETPVADLKAESKMMFAPAGATPAPVVDTVRVLDRDAIEKFFSAKPDVTIAIASDARKGVADKLAAALSAKGIKVTIKPEPGLLGRAKYPRVLNPTATVYSVGGDEKPPSGAVKENIQIDGPVSGDWRKPNSLVTVGGDGFLDWMAKDIETVYGPGVKIYLDDKKRPTVLNATSTEVKTDAAFREKWCKPWTRLGSYDGGYQLPPQLPEAYTADSHLIIFGDSESSEIATVLQASEILQQVADARYPGRGRAIVQFAWSPFAVGKNVVFIGASDTAGIDAGAEALSGLVH